MLLVTGFIDWTLNSYTFLVPRLIYGSQISNFMLMATIFNVQHPWIRILMSHISMDGYGISGPIFLGHGYNVHTP